MSELTKSQVKTIINGHLASSRSQLYDEYVKMLQTVLDGHTTNEEIKNTVAAGITVFDNFLQDYLYLATENIADDIFRELDQ